MFYTKLRGLYPSLTYSETKIADFILANKDTVSTLTSQQLADKLGISQPTVIRFSKKLGYRSYRNLILDLERSEIEDSVVEEIQVSDSTQLTNAKIKSYAKKLFDIVDEVNDPSDYDKTIEYILKAKIIFCYGFLSTSSIAQYMNDLLQLFGFNSYCMDNYSTMSALRNQGSDGLLLVFSKSGETAVTNEVASYAKERGLTVVGVTSMVDNTLSKSLDVWFKVVYSPLKTRFLHYTETIAQSYVVGCIILNLYKHDVTRYNECAAEHRALTRGSFNS